ncbi:ArnT family glycosyltransferase [Aeromicrobium fastidiosum]|uniref:Glycosyltransferase family 39 protein n=1 Tax=Aeromicrobium fastidiosum TaxID=52699 RepID=A0A641ANH1_9ACTN|nr:glycosyltransferase family 39 protein [Aeromicrobium fastidiosum]KAA1378281.1 glycosyltransferase family 39 protein [Aeromicrobium fastidiosum]MBP2388900.1 4-amino-4-deoxy-L-arabinose transferase-like glycosyltransferase [Aeromicrobium fastidiosum]
MTQTAISPPAPAPHRDATAPATPPSPSLSHARRLWRGREDDSPLVRPALLGLLLVTALLYLWGLGASGWANSFYAAAVQAGSESWKAFFFGSSDAASSITVDKTPMSLWPMSLSVRIFGLSSWAMLAPQALMGVASVGLLYATVRRTTHDAWASLLAGAALALTPVAVLMFRFNNPDALLTLLLIGSVHATIRAIENPARAVRWLALGGSLVGLAFLTKMLQAFLVLPPLALVYLLTARVGVVVRLKHLLIAFGSMIVAGGWWIAIVELWPASSRPYIGGSQDNSILELTLGYNGLGRLNGNETGSVGGGGGWGETGVFRLFTSEIGGQVAWLLPAALVLLGLSLWFVRRAGRTDRQLTGLLVWGGWLLVTGLTFSFMAGIFHAYYTVALAPAIAALVGIGASILWENRESPVASLGAAFVIAMTSATSFVLLDRSTDFVPWLKYAVVAFGGAAAFLVVAHRLLPRRTVVAAIATALAAVLVGPAAYAVDTASTPHTGSIPSAGPSAGGGMGGGPGGRMGGMRRPQGMTQGQGQAQAGGQTPTTPNGMRSRGGAGGGAGGLLNGSQSTDAINALLETDADSYTWVAAAVGSNTAAGYQLATELPVMAIGGFNGSDPSPTLAEFEQRVADGEIHYFIAGGGFGGGGGRGGQSGGSSSSSDIAAWVAETFTAQTVDGVTLYDLSGGVR